jgi:hypothetical protein
MKSDYIGYILANEIFVLWGNILAGEFPENIRSEHPRRSQRHILIDGVVSTSDSSLESLGEP